ncbi:MAG: MaoC/PaaZ C-terminal domain-containing protein [Candidatus Nanopelagicales bacterium]|nr:MaoC family dehydratase N-terminal domain-containing protein [Candidatus Nanopelagicales bacterium]
MSATIAIPSFDDVSVGDELPAQSFPIQRYNLVMYAGASGDFNLIHWNERIATMVGLPNVIAHGMFTMAEAARVLTDFAGDPSRVVEYGVRFTRPVVVPDDDKGATVDVSAVITEKREDGNVVVELTARSADVDVLGKARGVIRLRD